MKTHKEQANMIVTKDFIASVKNDTDYFNFISEKISQELANKLRAILENNGEVIAKMSDLRVFDAHEINSVEYKKQIEWSELVRCGECLHHRSALFAKSSSGVEIWSKWCELHETSSFGDDNDFCSYGERGDKKEADNES